MSSPLRQLSTTVSLVAALTAVLVLPASGAEPPASLVLVGRSPVVVEGRGFFGGERVTLRTNIGGQQFTRTIKAARDGRFSAQITDMDAGCWPFTVSAVGHRGRRAATRKINIPPPCGVPIQQ